MSPTRSPRLTSRRRSAGFTLVELLVVIVIIGILAGLALGALNAARQSARVEKTRATVAKLNHVVMQIYNEYRYRRVPLSDAQIQQIAAQWYPNQPVTLKMVAAIRLAVLRDIMRMEMPERRSDLLTPGTNNARGSLLESLNPPLNPPFSRPSLYQAYVSRAAAMTTNAPAECLYMIVTLAGGEDARQQFSDDEIADTDSNGLPEFIDGWGRPIYWLRAAPGFNGSEVQPNIPADPLADRNFAIDQAVRYEHDPFDTRKVEFAEVADPDPRYQGTGGKRAVGAWRLVPLIFSAGPDGQYGVGVDDKSGTYVWMNDTYTRQTLMGTPTDDSVYDNIHSHRLEVR